MFTRCRNTITGGEADLATEALSMWADRGWFPADKPAPTRGRKAAGDAGEPTSEKE